MKIVNNTVTKYMYRVIYPYRRQLKVIGLFMHKKTKILQSAILFLSRCQKQQQHRQMSVYDQNAPPALSELYLRYPENAIYKLTILGSNIITVISALNPEAIHI